MVKLVIHAVIAALVWFETYWHERTYWLSGVIWVATSLDWDLRCTNLLPPNEANMAIKCVHGLLKSLDKDIFHLFMEARNYW
jgi:hypothetical protein